MADFFLSPDDAKTLGDIEYMRQPNTVTHTFPGNVANGGSFSVTKQINAMEEKVMDARSTSSFSTPSTPAPKASNSSAPAPKTIASRPASNQSSGSIDFLKMAKGIRR